MRAVLVNNNDGIYSHNYSAEIEDWEDVEAEMSGWIPVDTGPLTGWEDNDGNWTKQVTYEHPKYGCHVTYFIDTLAPHNHVGSKKRGTIITTNHLYHLPESINKNLRTLECYLRDKIDNYYYELHINGGIADHTISITTYGPNNEHLHIQYIENHNGGHPMHDIASECEITNYSTYTPDQLYAVWRASL